MNHWASILKSIPVEPFIASSTLHNLRTGHFVRGDVTLVYAHIVLASVVAVWLQPSTPVGTFRLGGP